MKNILRWICVLPGAFVAMIVVNILNGLTVGFIFPDIVDQCSKAWFGSLAFVYAAGYIAPKGHFITSVVVASAYCGIGIFAVILAIRNGQTEHPIWLEIITLLLSVIASVLGAIMNAYDDEKKCEAIGTSKF